MKKVIRKIIAFGLVSVTLFSMSATAFAKEGEKQTKQPQIIIGDTAAPVPNNVIQDIIKENPDAGQITITDFGTSDVNKSNTSNQPMALAAGISYTNVVKNQTQSGVLAKTSFVISVAKGQTVAIGYEWSDSLSCTITGGIDKNSLGITGNISTKYSATQTFSGPSESSAYNSRSYYVKFYENRGTYTATCHDSLLGTTITYPVSGSYTEPAYFVSYSVDSKVN
jgi:hypothetical protein